MMSSGTEGAEGPATTATHGEETSGRCEERAEAEVEVGFVILSECRKGVDFEQKVCEKKRQN